MPQDADSIDLRLAVVDARRELGRREPAEHDGVDRAESRAREHREHGLRHHRHVDHDRVAARDAKRAQRAGETRDLALQLGERVARDGLRDGAVVDQRALRAAPRLDVPVDAH